MKEKRIELAHDIIAEKIWQRLPEQDKQLRQIKKALQERKRLYQQGNGSLLGYKEVQAWEGYLERVTWEDDATKVAVLDFFNTSKAKIAGDAEIERQRIEAEKAQIEKNRRLQRRIWVGLGIVALVVGGLIWWASERNRRANESEEKAQIAQEQSESATENAEKAVKNASIQALIADSLIIVADAATYRARKDSTNAGLQKQKAKQASFIANKVRQEAEQVKIQAQFTAQKAQADSLRAAGKITEADEKIKELTLKTSSNLSNQALVAFREDNPRLALRLSQAALNNDSTNQKAKDILEQLSEYLSLTFQEITDYKISPDFKYIALLSSTENKKFILYSIEENLVLYSSLIENTVSNSSYYNGFYFEFAPDSKSIIFHSNSVKSSLTIYYIPKQKVIKTFSKSMQLGYSFFPCQFSPDGKKIAVLIHKDSPSLILYSIEEEEELQVFNNIFENPNGYDHSLGYMDIFKFSPDSKTIAVLEGEKYPNLLVFSIEDKIILSSFDKIAKTVIQKKNNKNYVNEVNFTYFDSYVYTPNSKFILVLKKEENDKLILYSIYDNKIINTFNNVTPTHSNRSNEIRTFRKFFKNLIKREYNSFMNSYQLSSSGNLLSILVNEKSPKLILYSIKEEALLHTFENIAKSDTYGYRDSYKISSDDDYIAIITGKSKKSLLLYSITKKSVLHIFENLAKSQLEEINGKYESYEGSFKFSPNNEFMAVLVNEESPTLSLYSFKSGLSNHNFSKIAKSSQRVENIFADYRYITNIYTNETTEIYDYKNSFSFTPNGKQIMILEKNDNIALSLYSNKDKNTVYTFANLFNRGVNNYESNTSDIHVKNNYYDRSSSITSSGNFLAILTKEDSLLYFSVFSFREKYVIKKSQQISIPNDSYSSDFYCFYNNENNVSWTYNKSIDIYDLISNQSTRILKHQNTPTVLKTNLDLPYLVSTSRHPKGGEILKITNPNISQDQVFDYYDKILPPLSEEEKRKYGIVY